MHPIYNRVPKAALVHGAYYTGSCRNAEYARWDADLQCFIHWRYKFGSAFLETIKHPEDDQVYDVFVTFEQVDKPESLQEIPLGDPTR